MKPLQIGKQPPRTLPIEYRDKTWHVPLSPCLQMLDALAKDADVSQILPVFLEHQLPQGLTRDLYEHGNADILQELMEAWNTAADTGESAGSAN